MKKNHSGLYSKNLPDAQSVGRAIRDLRRRAHLSQGELSDRLGMRQGPVCNLEQGKNYPSAQVLLRLSRILNCSIDDILQPSRYTSASVPPSAQDTKKKPALPASLLPTLTSELLADQTELTKTLESIICDYLALEDLCHAPRQARIPLQLPFDLSDSGLARLAAQIRELMGIRSAIVFDLLELFEQHGLRVVFLSLPDNLDSISFHDAQNSNVFIFIERDNTPEKQIFSLAYELGRLLLFVRAQFMGEVFIDSHTIQKAARLFAAHFLMPAETVHLLVSQTNIQPDEWSYAFMLRLKHRFGVSAQAFSYRLLELKLITPEREAEFQKTIIDSYGPHFKEPGNSRRILSPNGRLGDLLHLACQRKLPEAAAIAKRIKKLITP
jgi:Zn-dependent peptidase ImmA (M78 family)/transcriptional regulator with XRE-family HTH domain